MARFDERRTERSPRHPDWDYERELRRMRSRHDEEQERSGRGNYGASERWSEDYGRRGFYEEEYPRRSEGWSGQEDYGRGQYGYGGERGQESRWQSGGYGQQGGQDYGRTQGWGGSQYGSGQYGGAGRYGSGQYGAGGQYGSGQYGGGGQYGQGGRQQESQGGGFGAMRGEGEFGGGRMESYSGKGPKGFTRSPDRLKEQVCERLEEASDIDATDIDVTIEAQGEVILEGTVRDRWQKQAAERHAETVRGVRDVHNRLRVKSEDSGSRQAGGAGTSGASGTSGSSGSSGSTGAAGTSSGRKSGSF